MIYRGLTKTLQWCHKLHIRCWKQQAATQAYRRLTEKPYSLSLTIGRKSAIATHTIITPSAQEKTPPKYMGARHRQKHKIIAPGLAFLKDRSQKKVESNHH